MKSTVFFVALLASSSINGIGELTESPLKEDANRLIGKGVLRLYPEIRKMSAAKRIAFASYLRQEAAKDPEIRDSVNHILLVLGDEAAMQQFGREHKWRSLADTKNPRAVEIIAAGLMTNDDNPAYETPSHDAASQLAVVLLNWPEIPPEVSGWIMKFRGWIMNARDDRQLMREWWVANEAAWRRRDFAALKPGRDLVGRDRIDPRTLPSPPPATPEPLAAAPSIPQLPAPRPQQSAPATPPTLPSDPGSPVPFAVIAGACLVAVGWVLWLAHARRRAK